ncbi:MAG: NAD(P)H-dependent oxidoreductase, partial [Chloroflexota bacterium]
ENDAAGERISTVLRENLQTRGWETEHILLCEQKIGNCAGDFFCWTRSPGLCNINDDNRLIAARVVQSDLLIYLTPVIFGGYSSELKRMVDHQIQNILPFFQNVGGEIHHQKRYKKYPNLLVIGWMDSPDTEAEAVFRHLVKRNAINMYAPTSVCGLVVGAPSERALTSQIDGWLEDSTHGSNSPVPALPPMHISTPKVDPPRRAVLLAGSPRTKKSTSSSLGSYLMEQLAGHSVQTESIQIYTSLNSHERMQSMLASIDASDLVLLAFPLYVDSLPAPVMAALERVAKHRAGGRQAPQRFAAIANCGFPEAGHNSTALAVCQTFARQAGFIWAGSLALGGGEGLVHGTPLDQLDGRAIPLKKSLDLAADALAAGNEIPQAAVDIMAKPVISPWMYLLMGAYGWRQQAKKYGMERKLKQQPYRTMESAR